MGNKGIIVEIRGEEVRGMLFSSLLGRVRVEKMETVSIEDGKRSAAVERLLSNLPSDAAVTLLLPGHLFMVRRVFLPFKDRKKIRKVLPYEIEGLLPFPVDELLIDSVLSAPTDNGTNVIAIAIPRRSLADYTDIFPEGRKPSKVIPDFLSLVSLGIKVRGGEGVSGVIEVEGGKVSMAFLSAGRPVLMRSVVAGGGFSSLAQDVRTTIKPLLNESLNIEGLYVTGSGASQAGPLLREIAQVIPLPVTVRGLPFEGQPSWTAIAGGALASAEYPWFNILGLHSESERVERTVRSVSMGTAVILILGSSDLYLRSTIDSQRYSALKAESKNVFLSAMPDVKKVVREDAQLKDALNMERGMMETLTGKPAPSYLTALKGVEKIVGGHPEIRVREASFEGRGLTIAGDGSGITADGVKKVFSGMEGAAGVQVEEMVQGIEANSYRFRVRIDMAGGDKDK